MLAHGGPVRSPEEFAALTDEIKPKVAGEVRRIVVELAPTLAAYADLAREIEQWEGSAIDDMRGQLEFFLPPHAITIHGMHHLKHLPRYLEAIRIRLNDIGVDPDRDAHRQAIVEEANDYLKTRVDTLPTGFKKSRTYKEIRWQIEELRVSVFAQRLGTPKPVSQRRIEKLVDKL